MMSLSEWTSAIRARQCFFEQLAAATGLPLHPWFARHGHAWPAQREGQRVVFHHVIVMPYCGSFRRQRGSSRPIPRIHLNHHDLRWHGPSKRTMQRWLRPEEARDARFAQSGFVLELTCTLEQLPGFAAWLVQYGAACAAQDPSLQMPSPHRLEGSQQIPAVARHGYLWTESASQEYTRWRQQDPKHLL